MACTRYIELNSVRAGMVDHSGESPWSSSLLNTHGSQMPLTPRTPSIGDWAVPSKSPSAYRRLFHAELNEVDIGAIREATNQVRNLGEEGVHLAQGPITVVRDCTAG